MGAGVRSVSQTPRPARTTLRTPTVLPMGALARCRGRPAAAAVGRPAGAAAVRDGATARPSTAGRAPTSVRWYDIGEERWLCRARGIRRSPNSLYSKAFSRARAAVCKGSLTHMSARAGTAHAGAAGAPSPTVTHLRIVAPVECVDGIGSSPQEGSEGAASQLGAPVRRRHALTRDGHPVNAAV